MADKIKNRTSLFDLKQRMRENIMSVDEYDLPMIVKWLFEIEKEMEEIKKEVT